MNKNQEIIVSKNKITLSDRDYKASGGQGTVFVKNNTAYKIYHDPNNMIPVAKIQELSILRNDEILSPLDVIYNLSNTPIGFTMNYIDNTEFLCKIFTKTFRKDKGITPKDVSELVTKMQKTLEYIHSKNILVVDYNEMNFLLGLFSNKMIYHIDVDSWQTKNFKAPALMESVRDKKTPNGHFTELTDWFSFAVVTFQIYAGIHPYKGMHPDFKPSELSKRMELGISVFDKKVKLPDACQDFSIIPKKHLEWYKSIFIKNDRSIPPYSDDISISMAVIRTIASKGDFIVTLIGSYKEEIKNVYSSNNKLYIQIENGLYLGNKKIANTETNLELCTDSINDSLYTVKLEKGIVQFFDLNRNLISTVAAKNMMEYNGFIYTINNGKLIQNSFEKLGKIIHKTDIICSICPSYRVFKGVIVQDDFMKCHLAIPYEQGKCTNIHIKELDGHRIIDAKYMDGVCIIISEKRGDYIKSILCFNKEHNNYTIKGDVLDSICDINFVTLPNKMCIMVEDEKVTLFKDNNQKKEISNAPFDSSMKLYNDGMKVLFVDDNKLYSVSMK